MKKGCVQKPSEMKIKTDCNVRLCCTLLAMIMGCGGVASTTFEQSSNGLVLCLFSIILMAMALGFRQIELICKELRMRLKR